MDYDTFKLIHSELIISVQYIEQDLKLIYSILKGGEFSDNYSDVENAPLGKLLRSLREMDQELGAILIFIILKIHKRMKRDFKRWLSDCIKMNCVFMIYSRRLRNYVKVLRRSIGIKREFNKLQVYER